MDLNLDIDLAMQSGVILLVGWSHTHVATGLTHAGSIMHERYKPFFYENATIEPNDKGEALRTRSYAIICNSNLVR
jgi:hypothetical protein